jgi:four helix bundle protein
LRVWQAARELWRGVYHAIRTQNVKNEYTLVNQMRRSALSIGDNIAEGNERGTRRQHIEQCYTAKGSAGELRSQVIFAHDVGLLDEKAFRWLHEHCESCSRMLAAYIRHLERSQDRFSGLKNRNQRQSNSGKGG